MAVRPPQRDSSTQADSKVRKPHLSMGGDMCQGSHSCFVLWVLNPIFSTALLCCFSSSDVLCKGKRHGIAPVVQSPFVTIQMTIFFIPSDMISISSLSDKVSQFSSTAEKLFESLTSILYVWLISRLNIGRWENLWSSRILPWADIRVIYYTRHTI